MSFYTLDSEGFGAVARFVADGWAGDECVVLVATGPHRAAVETLLVALGHDPASQAASGRYLTLDAEETLAELVVDGHLDADLFMRRVDEVVTEASAAGRPIRAFGEMVALLWQRGQIEEAISLELLWNQLLRDYDFSLLCAYPTGVFDHAELVDVRRVCDLHTDLMPVDGSSSTDGAQLSLGHACSRVYLPTASSVPAARHFVVDVLKAWGHDSLTADAALIVSELATNAVTHAASPFRALVDRRRGGLRIGVEDAARAPLERRTAEADDISGRGVDIVAALSARWGYSPVPGGKVVWAELLLDPTRSRAG
ncbi:MEDS domain-containing protein [Terracoccus sp. 273MFTsu3.1]|uniref:MEDS domain-containing protein n=1 Tax=Terracoccus sp. 273MFTsu3.1 TaxID=1172188 RepID=UPI000376A436|nr:MEDS domain-containing protein [Terracoccus sp. 273MFTsu3.1]